MSGRVDRCRKCGYPHNWNETRCSHCRWPIPRYNSHAEHRRALGVALYAIALFVVASMFIGFIFGGA